MTLCQWSGPNLCGKISSVQKWKLIESLAANSSWDTLYKLAYFVKPSLDNAPLSPHHPHPLLPPSPPLLFHLSFSTWQNIITLPENTANFIPSEWLMVWVCLIVCEVRYLMMVSAPCLHLCSTRSDTQTQWDVSRHEQTCPCTYVHVRLWSVARIAVRAQKQLVPMRCCAAWRLIMTLNVYEHWSAIAPKWDPFHILTGHGLTAYWWMHNDLRYDATGRPARAAYKHTLSLLSTLVRKMILNISFVWKHTAAIQLSWGAKQEEKRTGLNSERLKKKMKQFFCSNCDKEMWITVFSGL